MRQRNRHPPTQVPLMRAAAVLSFLKQTKLLDAWTTGDLAKSLNISLTAARGVTSVLEMQGYIKKEGSQWSTTNSGYTVSGAKLPRLKRSSVEAAITSLTDWIRVVNKDAEAAYRISKAVAFGDFLNRSLPRVQAADVGIQLQPRNSIEDQGSFNERRRESRFLRQLRGGSVMLNVRPFEQWMGERTNVKLI